MKMYYVESNGIRIYQGNNEKKAYQILSISGSGTSLNEYNAKTKSLDKIVSIN